ncbi:ClbS/DfsB family four-helix bundle protein [Ruegeria arenilitoris]|uniref:ClbS/DfsB family four-helix bundle protein n=1 Tax=Ruegeria arenilitoris TaxID=1173585 RepID=UPI00147AB797|nr:ClbS/DfsB family four-helix bundle protein [Ruegeria arenilitoris]
MAASSKADLLAITEKEFSKLRTLITPLEPQQALLKDDDETSIKDVIGHRAHWIDLFLGWYADGQAGKEVYFPARGYKWNELRRYNLELRQKQANLSWDEAVQELDAGYRNLAEFLETRSNAELYEGPMQGAKNNWTPGRWAEAAGASHFRSAAKYIRGRLRSL